jgi:hypothetical protein
MTCGFFFFAQRLFTRRRVTSPSQSMSWISYSRWRAFQVSTDGRFGCPPRISLRAIYLDSICSLQSALFSAFLSNPIDGKSGGIPTLASS